MAETVTSEELRHRLTEEREQLQKEIDGMADLRSQSDDPTLDIESYGNHPANAGSETYEMEKNLGLLENLRGQLAMTDAALARLDQGSYGVCTNCGRPIDPDRLEALPHAALCIDCKRLQEAQR